MLACKKKKKEIFSLLMQTFEVLNLHDVLCLSQSKDYPSLVAFCIFFGISYGMVGALQFEVLMAIVGTEKFSSAIGLVLLMEAIAVLVGPPGAGQWAPVY